MHVTPLFCPKAILQFGQFHVYTDHFVIASSKCTDSLKDYVYCKVPCPPLHYMHTVWSHVECVREFDCIPLMSVVFTCTLCDS